MDQQARKEELLPLKTKEKYVWRERGEERKLCRCPQKLQRHPLLPAFPVALFISVGCHPTQICSAHPHHLLHYWLVFVYHHYIVLILFREGFFYPAFTSNRIYATDYDDISIVTIYQNSSIIFLEKGFYSASTSNRIYALILYQELSLSNKKLSP